MATSTVIALCCTAVASIGLIGLIRNLLLPHPQGVVTNVKNLKGRVYKLVSKKGGSYVLMYTDGSGFKFTAILRGDEVKITDRTELVTARKDRDRYFLVPA